MIVCTELYLLAQGVGSGLLLTEEVVVLVLLTLQTTWLLVHVSLAAAGVQEQVCVCVCGGAVALLRKGCILKHFGAYTEIFDKAFVCVLGIFMDSLIILVVV